MAGDKPGYESYYKKKMLPVVIEEFRGGASVIEVAAAIGIKRSTFYDWCNPSSPRFNSDFKEAVDFGRDVSEAWWMRTGRDNLHNRNFNSALWYMNMKNRFGWSDKQETRDASEFTKESVLDELENDD